jgi:antirestriction protein ArdC
MIKLQTILEDLARLEPSAVLSSDIDTCQGWNLSRSVSHSRNGTAEVLTKQYRTTLTIRRGRPRYEPSIDLVTVPSIKRFANANRYYHVLNHELIHSTGLFSRLARTCLYTDKITEELTAELGALILDSNGGTLDAETYHNTLLALKWYLRKTEASTLRIAWYHAELAVQYITNFK